MVADKMIFQTSIICANTGNMGPGSVATAVKTAKR
jgi:hypothetical protein